MWAENLQKGVLYKDIVGQRADPDLTGPLWPDHMGQRRSGSEVREVAEKVDHARSEVRGNMP